MQTKHWLGFAALAALTACTPAEVERWVEWHNTDPAAAEAFANLPEVQARLAEPEAPPEDMRRGDVWDRIAECESGRTWSYNGGSGYDGGLQFLPATWRAYGGREFAEYAWQASREQQITVANRVLEDVGWQAWPACSRKLGLR
jgi:hypothetical protein